MDMKIYKQRKLRDINHHFCIMYLTVLKLHTTDIFTSDICILQSEYILHKISITILRR